MPKLEDVCDIIQRRCRFLLEEFPVESIYVTIDNVVGVKFILADDHKENVPTALKLKAIHLFEDQKTQYLFRTARSSVAWRNPDGYVIYKKDTGFLTV